MAVDLVKYYRLYCHSCREYSYGTSEEYDAEMSKPDAMWRCNKCGVKGAIFDDEYWERNEGITEDD